MILSTRNMAPRNLNLTQAKTKNNNAFRQLLLNSPLPSPSLPSIVPRHGKKPPPLNTKMVLRGICWLTGLVFFFWLLISLSRREKDFAASEYRSSNGRTYEIVGEDDLPEYPSPVMVTDNHGQSRWTISIPQILEFPLLSCDYEDICSQSDDIARHVETLTGRQPHNGYDPSYIDVAQAQRKGLLPPHQEAHKSEHNVCKSSLTFVLDDSSAGLGTNLLSLWLAFSLAKREGRTFFLEHQHFVYGKYAELFQLPSTPKCVPPPNEERVPCPRQATHLAMNAKTISFIMSSRFGRREIFDMAREGYEALYHLSNDEDKNWVDGRLATLRYDEGKYVGVHIRHGDRHPLEFQYEHSYTPTRKYMGVAEEVLTQYPNVKFVVSSDDPDVFDDPELTVEERLVERAQNRISLASRKTSGGLGWEGGFFKDMFWGLALPDDANARRKMVEKLGSPPPSRKKSKSQAGPGVNVKAELGDTRNYRTHPTEEALQLRELIGRAYLLDLEVLRRSDVVVCGGASAACQILGVMMGWDAVQDGRWRNIDAGVDGWRWNG